MLRQALQRVFSAVPPPPPSSSPPPDPMPIQLQDLPTELLQYIASLLPLSSAAILALSSRSMLAKLGTSYFTQLKKETLPPVESFSGTCGPPDPRLSPPQQEREDFLVLLDRDLRDTIYCYYCREIHDPMKTLKDSWKPREKRRACTKCEAFVAIHHHIHNDFCFSRFQMIMKRSERFRIDCSAQMQKLSRTCTYHGRGSYASQSPFFDQNFTHQVTTYARIVSGCLILRTVHWLLVEWKFGLKFPKYTVKICPHFSATQNNLPEEQRHHPFIAVAQPGSYGDRSIRRVAGYHLNQCHLCSTEFEMDGAECGRNLFALRTSVWQDFGDCSSLYDPKCKHYRRKYKYRTSLGSTSPPWSIKVQFEESCSDAQKLGRLDLPKGLYLAKGIKTWIKGGVGIVGYRYTRSCIVTSRIY
jgi:hypothetical protein